MTISAKSFLGDEDYCSPNQKSKCFVFIIFNLASLSFGCLPIIFIGDAAWSAFKKKRHWIPAGSLVVGALVIQFLSLLDSSFNFPGDVFTANQQSQIKGFFKDYAEDYEVEIPPSQITVDDDYTFLILYSNWVSVLCGRVSMFVLMGCLLPGVARPLSGNLWRDMAALFISSSVSLFHISYETFRMAKLEFALLFSFNLAMLVSLVVLLLLLVFAALASVSISKTWSHKIPTMILVQNLSTQVVWETVEERAIRSLMVARTGDPQYMLARSILTSSIALVITICNGILVFEICRFTYGGVADTFLDIWFVLRCVVIVMGSIIIYWRCITAVVFYPKARAKFFQIEEFWKSHLLDLIDSFDRSGGYGGTSGNTSLGESIMSLMCKQMGLHKLLYVLHYLEMFCIFLSKLCWALTQLFFSKIIGSAYNKFRNLCKRKSRREGSLGKNKSDYPKYSKSLVVMEGESPEAIWMANRKSVLEIKKKMEEEDEEGRNCTDLITLLTNNSSSESCARLRICHHNILEVQGDLDVDVESELNVGKHSWKMTTVSIIAVIVELSTYIEDQGNAENLVSSVMRACSQAWSIMDVIEVSDGEAVEVSEAANDIFHSLEREPRKWLDWCLPVSTPTDQRTLTEAKRAMQSLIEKGKEKAKNIAPCDNGKNRKKKTDTRKWSERVAGYNMYKLGVHLSDPDHQFLNVEAILKKLGEMLADVIGSCMVKVVGVIMEDLKKQASLYDEESILRLAGIAGKVKGVTERLGWNLKWTTDEGNQSFETSLEKDEVPTMKRRATFLMG